MGMISSTDIVNEIAGRLTTSEILDGLYRHCSHIHSLVIMGPVSPETVSRIVQLFPDLESLAIEISVYGKIQFLKCTDAKGIIAL